MSAIDTASKPGLAATFGTYRDESASLEARRASYRDMIGHVPPRVNARLEITGALDPVALSLQEQIRDHAMAPGVFDAKTIQLMIFGMMMAELSDAAHLHAQAARRAGASWEELQAVITLCAVFRGVPAANRGADILAKVAREAAPATAGA